MQLREVLELAAVLLQLQPLLDSGVFTQHLSREEVEEIISSNKDLQLLIRCANLVYKEIACDYVPLSTTDTLSTTDGVISYYMLLNNLLEITKVTDSKGNEVSYNCYAGQLHTQKGVVEITYNYVPKQVDFFNSLDYANSKVTDRLLAYGIAAEYCLICGQGQDALVWDRRYKDALTVACRRRKEVRMPLVKSWY